MWSWAVPFCRRSVVDFWREAARALVEAWRFRSSVIIRLEVTITWFGIEAMEAEAVSFMDWAVDVARLLINYQ